jgi:Hemopexin
MSEHSSSSPISLTGNSGEKHLINIVPHRGDAFSIKPAPCLISLNLDDSLFKAAFGGNLKQNKLFDTALNGGKYYPDRVWFFRGNQYYRYYPQKPPKEALEGPIAISPAWGQGTWPTEFATGIDAALLGTGTYEGKAWFFKGSKYIRYDLTTDKVEFGPVPIAGSWGRETWPVSFAGGIDAALHGLREHFGKAWFFKGNEVIQYNMLTDRVEAGPVPLTADPAQGGWKNWPAAFANGIDYAIYGTGVEAERIYFFKGDQFFIYDLKTANVLGSPRSITGKFPAFVQFIRKPQLFLVESYSLTTYYGDLTPENFSSGPQISPGSEETYTVRVKRTTVTDITQTKTVLESQDQKLVSNLNDSMKESSASGTQTEKYDWKINASFHGDLSVDFTGGETNAQFNANGETNTVRHQFSQATERGVSKQVNDTYENHKQTINTVNSGYQATDEFESVWTRKVSNPTNQVVSLGYAQLAQEYISLVVLEDIKLAFSNSEDVEVVPLSKMDGLLAKYLDDSVQLEKAKTWIVNELQEILDYQGTPCNVLKEISPQRYQFDPDLKSQLTLTNLDGTPRKKIVVKGLIIDHHRFKQLTDLVVMTEINVG